MKDKIKKIWQWFRKNILNKEMFVFVCIAECIFWSPCAVMAILAKIVSPYFWGVLSAYCSFWFLPITPGFAIRMGLAVSLKKIYDKKHKGVNNDSK